MGTWLHGWVEVEYGSGDSGQWSPVLKTEEVLPRQSWWRVPLFGRNRYVDGFFEPIPYEPGVPDAVSPAVAADVVPEDDVEGRPDAGDVDAHVFDPYDETGHVTFAELRTVDWNEPRNDVTDELLELDGPPLHDSVRDAFEFVRFDADGRPVDRRVAWGDLDHDHVRDLRDRGWTTLDGDVVRPLTRHRRDYLPPQWFRFVDLLRTLAERGSVGPEDVRWFFYFTY